MGYFTPIWGTPMLSTKCTYDCQPSIDIKIEVKLPDGAKDPVF